MFNCEVLAIGTELLLGQIVDTNSAWLGQRLAEVGLPCYLQVKVGDNHARIVAALRDALGRADAVICCGGLGPTQDDITREAIAEVMGVGLERRPDLEEHLRARFKGAFGGRPLPAVNLKQADVPQGAEPVEAKVGTAPGLICPIGDKVVYALAGVPAEMKEMFDRAVLPDLLRRAGSTATIRSRFLRVWGEGESRVAELVAPRLRALEGGPTTIAFLASVTEGVRVRVTTRAEGQDAEVRAHQVLDAEEAQLRAILGDAVGGIDDQGLEFSVAKLLLGRHWRLAVAESLTAGMVCARLASVPAASDWFVGGVVSYAEEVKHELLEVGAGPVVSGHAAAEMARGVARLLHADVGLALTGVAGPTTQDGQPVGTVFVGAHLPVPVPIPAHGAQSADGGEAGGQSRAFKLALLRGDRQMVRDRASTASLDQLRRVLLALG